LPFVQQNQGVLDILIISINCEIGDFGSIQLRNKKALKKTFVIFVLHKSRRTKTPNFFLLFFYRQNKWGFDA
jgi:hypothetical protein